MLKGSKKEHHYLRHSILTHPFVCDGPLLLYRWTVSGDVAGHRFQVPLGANLQGLQEAFATSH